MAKPPVTPEPQATQQPQGAQKPGTQQPGASPKPPLKWMAILFAFATNILLVTLSNGLVQTLHWPAEAEVLATLVAPVAAGVLTALYARQRGAMHAFLGGMLSVPALAIFIFNGVWQFALLSGAFCTLGGAITEVLTRRTERSA